MKDVLQVHITLLSVFTGVFTLLSLAPGAAVADELQSSIARGGRLYDNWYLEIRTPAPTASHPAYPAGRAHSADPQTNWRCKECHGWDYRGADGAYSEGPHATGIKGIRNMAAADPNRIVAILKDETHAYGGLMADGDFRDLANFVSMGQIDMDRYIDRRTKTAKGGKSLRQDHYQSICAGCHGRDGFKLRSIAPLGDVARHQPWESLHKILNGHPAERMPALRALDLQVLVDILAYVQALPDGETVASIVRGGRLYDNWRKEIGGFTEANTSLDYPANRKHPAYPIDKAYAKDPGTNWRCKECHGWDYRGADGAYSEGPHYTGIKGIRSMANADPAVIVSVLKDDNHRYDDILEVQDLRDLANFVSKGQVDMNAYIDGKTGSSKGDKAANAAYYTTICAACHGLDGTAIITTSPIGRIARRNPWEVLHKMANGHPDEAMPALRVQGLEVLANILSYVQSLPAER